MYKIYSKYGILIAAGLIVYFLIFKVIGLHEYPLFSLGNGVIFAAGMYFALKRFRNVSKKMVYLEGFELGLFTGGIASILFTIFIAVYSYQIDREFASVILENWNLEYDLGTSMIVLSTLIMGFATTMILSFTFMQLFKTTQHHHLTNNKQTS